MSQPKGYIIDVPVTLSVAIRGASLEQAKQLAREFAKSLDPHEEYVQGYSEGLGIDGVTITEASLESSYEDSCEVLEELDEE